MMTGFLSTALASVLLDRGDLDGTVEVASTALAAGGILLSSRAALWLNLGHAHLRAGRVELAIHGLSESLELQRSAGLHYQRGTTQILLGEAHARSGRLDRGLHDLTTGVRRLQSLRRQHQRYVALGWGWIARLHAGAGSPGKQDLAVAAARRAVEPLHPDLHLAVEALVTPAQVIASPGDAAAREHGASLVAGTHDSMDVEARIALDQLAGSLGADLTAAPDASVFQLRGQAPVDISKYRANRAILAMLIERHLRRAGEVCSVDDLVGAGWPGESQTAESGTRRVYTAISALRSLGLRDILERAPGGGYRLRPELVVRRA
jgi:tetratricopeptide (TPR) repeat protein